MSSGNIDKPTETDNEVRQPLESVLRESLAHRMSFSTHSQSVKTLFDDDGETRNVPCLLSEKDNLNNLGPLDRRIAELSLDKLEKRILRFVGQAVGDFHLIEEGDKILVAISGGKDSWMLLHVLQHLQKKAPVNFQLLAVNIDQGFPGFQKELIEENMIRCGVEYVMTDFNTIGLIEDKLDEGETPCSLCSRMRRGVLYGLAEKHKCNKIALGHHLDDFIETLFLNVFFNGRIAAMAPKLLTDDNKNTVIRPLVYVSEAEIVGYIEKQKIYPIVNAQCPLVCEDNHHHGYKRKYIKSLIRDMEEKNHEIRNSLLAALGNIKPSHLLDKRFWDFT